jgi:uncharacterized protein (TIGR00730 family)
MIIPSSPPRSICVYCSSSNAVDAVYREAARETGRLIAKAGYSLVYGGTRIGLMGEVSAGARDEGGKVTGIVPEHIRARILDCEDAEALVVTPDMRQRKARMEQLSDAFLALPGGFGTLEEVMEIITLKQLGLHAKPVVFLNAAGFYEPLLAFFETIFRERFARQEYAALYSVVSTPSEALQEVERVWGSATSLALTKWD